MGDHAGRTAQSGPRKAIADDDVGAKVLNGIDDIGVEAVDHRADGDDRADPDDYAERGEKGAHGIAAQSFQGQSDGFAKLVEPTGVTHRGHGVVGSHNSTSEILQDMVRGGTGKYNGRQWELCGML